MSPASKIWIYFSEKVFDESTKASIELACKTFCNSWTAHETPLAADYKIIHNQFIILMVDETQNIASGCSIDKSVAFIRALGQTYGLDFFNRLSIPFFIDNKVHSYPFQSLQSLFDNGTIHAETPVFNLQVNNLEDFEKHFIQKLGNHWLFNKLKTTINQ